MRSLIALVLALAGLLPLAAGGADDGGVAGTWRGPWYRGMTSGLVTIELAADGSGTIQFTNLENFGEAPAELRDVKVDGKNLMFSASGRSGAEFKATANVAADGSKMRGNARYEGFGVRFEARLQGN